MKGGTEVGPQGGGKGRREKPRGPKRSGGKLGVLIGRLGRGWRQVRVRWGQWPVRVAAVVAGAVVLYAIGTLVWNWIAVESVGVRIEESYGGLYVVGGDESKGQRRVEDMPSGEVVDEVAGVFVSGETSGVMALYDLADTTRVKLGVTGAERVAVYSYPEGESLGFWKPRVSEEPGSGEGGVVFDRYYVHDTRCPPEPEAAAQVAAPVVGSEMEIRFASTNSAMWISPGRLVEYWYAPKGEMAALMASRYEMLADGGWTARGAVAPGVVDILLAMDPWLFLPPPECERRVDLSGRFISMTSGDKTGMPAGSSIGIELLRGDAPVELTLLGVSSIVVDGIEYPVGRESLMRVWVEDAGEGVFPKRMTLDGSFLSMQVLTDEGSSAVVYGEKIELHGMTGTMTLNDAKRDVDGEAVTIGGLGGGGGVYLELNDKDTGDLPLALIDGAKTSVEIEGRRVVPIGSETLFSTTVSGLVAVIGGALAWAVGARRRG